MISLLPLLPLAQAATTPDGVPAWLWLVLTAIGSFLVANMPWIRQQLDAAFKERRTTARRQADELTERLITAQETTAAALKSIAETNRSTADALNIFASHWSATSLHLDEIRRDLSRLRGDEPPGRLMARKAPEEAPRG
jgi:hypothetical protein